MLLAVLISNPCDMTAVTVGAGLIGAVPPDAKPYQAQAADMVVPHQVDGIGIGAGADVRADDGFDTPESDVGRDQDQRQQIRRSCNRWSGRRYTGTGSRIRRSNKKSYRLSATSADFTLLVVEGS